MAYRKKSKNKKSSFKKKGGRGKKRINTIKMSRGGRKIT